MTTDPHDEEHPMSAPEPDLFVAEESHSLAPASSSRLVETATRTSRRTTVVDHLANDERPWADHLSPAEREQLTTYLADHPERAPAHLAAHLSNVGILTRPASLRSTPRSGSEPPEEEQP